MRQPLNKLAIVIGIGVDVIASFAALLGLIVLMVIMSGGAGLPSDEMMAAWFANPLYLAAEFVIATLPTVLSGYIAGRVAKRDQVRHAAWVGAVMLVVYAALALVPMEGASEPVWYDFLEIAATIPAAVLGGRLSIGRH